MRTRHLRGFGGIAAFTALTLAGCATDTSRQARVQPRDRSPPASGVETQAMAFESFMRNARAIDAGFSSADEVSRALRTGASHEPVQFEAGMVAFAAMAALQEPAFVVGVKRAARSGDLAVRLAARPADALDLPGADAAAGRAAAALAREGERLGAAGRRVKQAAYSVQRQGWSKSDVADASGRLARVKRISATRYHPAEDDAAHLLQAVSEGGRRSGAPSPLVARGVALAALSVLGEADRGRALMKDARAASCLRLAKLMLYQCLASARPQYEDIYCLGQHAMIDPGQCVADAARAPARPMSVARAETRR